MTRSKHDAAGPIGVESSGIDVLDRAAAILLAFRAGESPLTLTELSARTGMYKSTVSRLAGALCHHRFMSRLDDGRYQLGATTYTLGARYEASLNVRDALLPVMRELNAYCGETVSFHVRDADARICLLRIAARFTVRAEVQPGDVQALDKGAGGRVLLAFSGEAGEPYETVRRTFTYLSMGERDPETAGLSAPVFGPNGRLMGAVGVVAPLMRTTAERTAVWLPALLGAAATATERLGGASDALRRAALAAAEAADQAV